jgi:hypothetical protein
MYQIVLIVLALGTVGTLKIDGSHQQSHQLMMMSWLDNDVFFLADRFRQSSRQEVDNNETKRPQIFHHTNTTQNAKATLLLLPAFTAQK